MKKSSTAKRRKRDSEPEVRASIVVILRARPQTIMRPKDLVPRPFTSAARCLHKNIRFDNRKIEANMYVIANLRQNMILLY